MRYALLIGLAVAAVGLAFPSSSDEAPVRKRADKTPPCWPMFGGSPSRNMVNLDVRGVPADWCVEEGKVKNIKWTAALARRTFGTPVVGEGMVFVGTSKPPRKDPNGPVQQAVLRAFREVDGKSLWENVHDIDPKIVSDAGNFGLLSTPTVVGRRVYYVTPTCEVICADIDDGKIAWKYDMMKALKVVPFHANICAPLVVGDHVFVCTANGTDEEGRIPAPEAPSFVALHRETGKLVWQSNLPGKNIIEGQWSNPTYAEIGGVPQVIFAGGDSVIYSLMPGTGELIWKCDCLPVRKKPGREMDNYIVATPVVVGARLYVGMGVHPEHGNAPAFSYFLCLDLTKKGDVSLKSYDAKAAVNKDSALVWAFGGPIEKPVPKERRVHFGRTISTAAVHDGLVYIAEETGYLHCLDAATGLRYWQHDFKDSVWGSPYWVDGRIFVGTQAGDVVIFAHGRTAQVIATIDMEEAIDSSPVAANGTLYVATLSKLFAISSR
jgi:outer membrane protein assembly factor BamB